MSVASNSLLTFRAGGRAHAVAAEAVREVVRRQRLTPVPHAPAGLAGLGNIRGRAVPILSVAGLRNLPHGAERAILILERDPVVGLLVDEVTAVADGDDRSRRLDLDALLSAAYAQAPGISHTRSIARAAPMTSARSSAVAGAAIALIAFAVAGQTFALPLDQVAEVVALSDGILPMPGSDTAVAGTILHRGVIVPLLRLHHLLGLESRRADGRGRVVIVRIRGRRVGLVVDAVHSIMRLDESAVDAVPAVISRRAGEARIQAIGRLPDGQGLISILAADRLLDETLMAQVEEPGAEEDIVSMASAGQETFLLFALGGESFALPAMAVEAVVRIPETLVRVPKAPAFIEGVINLRGEAIPVIDQRRRFGAAASPLAGKRAILLSLGALRACFVVDSVEDVRPIAGDAISPAPEIGVGPQLFDRVATLDGGQRLVLLIEPGQLLDQAERDTLAALAVQAGTETA